MVGKLSGIVAHARGGKIKMQDYEDLGQLLLERVKKAKIRVQSEKEYLFVLDKLETTALRLKDELRELRNLLLVDSIDGGSESNIRNLPLELQAVWHFFQEDLDLEDNEEYDVDDEDIEEFDEDE